MWTRRRSIGLFSPSCGFRTPSSCFPSASWSRAQLTYILPAGQFQRRDVRIDGVTRKLVVPGTYDRIARQPVGVFGGLVAIPTGFVDFADVIALVFLVGGAFCVVEETGVLEAGTATLLARFGRRRALLIWIACVIFGAGARCSSSRKS